MEANHLGDHEPLREAVRVGDLDKVKELVDQGESLDYRDEEGKTLLFLASRHGHAEVATFLLSAKKKMSTKLNSGVELDRSMTLEMRPAPDVHVSSTNKANGDGAAETPTTGPDQADTDETVEETAYINVASNTNQTPLYIAVAGNHAEVVRLLLDAGCDPNIPAEWGFTPLHAAGSFGNLEIAKILCENGANLEHWGTLKQTPLHSTVRKGHLEIVKVLLSKGADFTVRDGRGRTPLYRAIERGHLEVAKLLLERDADVEVADDKEWTPLHMACHHGHEEILPLLLAKRPNLSRGNKDFDTALQLAARHGSKTMVKMLLEAGAELEPDDARECTPLIAAVESGKCEVVQMILDEGANVEWTNCRTKSALFRAIELKQFDIVQFLVDRGADIHRTSNTGWSPLNFAAEAGCAEITKYFLDKGVDPKNSNERGYTPLMSAVRGQHQEVVATLLEHGDVGLNQQCKKGWTPLLLASYYGCPAIARVLLEHGADVALTRADGFTALYTASVRDHFEIACLFMQRGAEISPASLVSYPLLFEVVRAKNLEMAKLLVDRGVDLEERNSGWTALHLAAKRGDQEIVELLVEKGADIEAKSDEGYTPLIFASWAQPDTMKLLVSKGADITAADALGHTALHRAAEEGYPDSVEFLLSLDTKLEILGRKTNDGDTALHLAARNGYIHITHRLVEGGANTVVENANGCTPLLRAASKGNVEIVKYLLDECPESHHAPDAKGRTPLHVACHGGHLEVVKALLESDAFAVVSIDANAEPEKDAEDWEHAEVKMSLDEINTQSISGSTPLHVAGNAGHDEVVVYLLQKGADQSTPNEKGWTPFLSAAFYGHAKVVEVLLAHSGCEPLSVDPAGRNAVFLAASRGRREVVENLLKISALDKNNIHKGDKYHATALSAALRNGHELVVADLLKVALPSIYTQDFGGKTLGEWIRLVECSSQLKDLFLGGEHTTEGLNEGEQTVLGTKRRWCDVCLTLLYGSDSYYRCPSTYTKRKFLVCNRCYELGLECPDGSRELIFEEKKK